MGDEVQIDKVRRDQEEAETKRREKVARWQKLTIEQFGYSLNLFITLAVAALGYCFQLLRDPSFHPGCYGKSLFIISVLMLSVSIVLGGSCTLNRLLDFRGSANRARRKRDAPSSELLTAKGKCSWMLLKWMMGMLGMGTLALGLSLVLTYWRKL